MRGKRAERCRGHSADTLPGHPRSSGSLFLRGRQCGKQTPWPASRSLWSTRGRFTRVSSLIVGSRAVLIVTGRNLLDALLTHGIPCTLCVLPTLPTHLKRASLTLLGASALHSDGALHSRAGTALVAMLSKEYRVPVVACVETYKFGEKVVLDGLGSNEMGSVDGLVQLPGKKAKTAGKDLTPLALTYDLTPPEYITAVCTEVSIYNSEGKAALMHAARLHSPKLGPDGPRQGKRCRLIPHTATIVALVSGGFTFTMQTHTACNYVYNYRYFYFRHAQAQASILSPRCGNIFSSLSSSIRRRSLCGFAVLGAKGFPRALDPLALRSVRPCPTRGVT